MSAPGGLSDSEFKVIALEAGQWLWGTVQGAFNEKATVSQIVVDAVVGMIPLVGDATAVRDLIAITIGLADSPKKREDVWEWVLLIVFIVALIPVIGGVAKGVGRLLVTGARTAAPVEKTMLHIVELLNRLGHGNAERWLKTFSFAAQESAIVEKFNNLIYTLNTTLIHVQRKLHRMLPGQMLQRIDALGNGLQVIKEAASKRIPEGVRKLDQLLREGQAYIRSGGQTTSRTVAHKVATGTKATTYAEEARLIEESRPLRSLRGGIAQNKANIKKPKSYEAVYKHEPGFPDLTSRPDPKTGDLKAINAYGGKIVNRELHEGEELFRLFGPPGKTHLADVVPTVPAGVWWGLGKPPKNAKEWRLNSAVLDEWNRDGFMAVATVQKDAKIKACVGKNSEMYGERIPGQYLPGGGTQAFINFDAKSAAELERLGQQVMATGEVVRWSDPITGMRFEIRPTGWKDANGIHGYLESAHPAYVQTVKLGAREKAAKDNQETLLTGAAK